MAAFAPPTSPTVSAAHSRATASPPSPTSPVRRTRTTSITQSLIDANPHYGICAATGDALASAPSLKDLRRHSSSRSRSALRRGSSVSTPGVPIREEGSRQPGAVESLVVAGEKAEEEERGNDIDMREEGDKHEEEHKPGWWAVTVQGLLAFWKFFKTPMGFFITIYMLNVVAWGGMLFLLLCNAAPAMCVPTCNDINSPRRVWIEIDSQILNALFCVTGFGLIPWRFRDLWFLMKWRVGGRKDAAKRLAGIHSGWFRLPVEEDGEQMDRGRRTEEEEAAGEDTVTGVRAPPTKSWKMDFVVWMYVWNTFLQAVLSGFMWGMNRIERPSWSTGLFVALACIVAGMAGWMVWREGKKVKRIEGVKEKDEDEKEKRKGKGRKADMEEVANTLMTLSG